MRTAGMVLGIIGGSIALIIAVVVFVVALLSFATSDFIESEVMSDMDGVYEACDAYGVEYDSDIIEESLSYGAKTGGYIAIGTGIALFISGILGIVGGAMTKKKHVLAGVFMLISAVLSFITIWGILAGLLLLLGGIFALVKVKPKQEIAAA